MINTYCIYRSSYPITTQKTWLEMDLTCGIAIIQSHRARLWLVFLFRFKYKSCVSSIQIIAAEIGKKA